MGSCGSTEPVMSDDSVGRLSMLPLLRLYKRPVVNSSMVRPLVDIYKRELQYTAYYGGCGWC